MSLAFELFFSVGVRALSPEGARARKLPVLAHLGLVLLLVGALELLSLFCRLKLLFRAFACYTFLRGIRLLKS
jgi:hypothetical protein